MNRAYSTIQIRSVNDEMRIIEGIASTPVTDRMGDVVDPKGAHYKLPIPFLWQHDSKEPIGHVTKAIVTKEGIRITAQIAKGVLPRIDEAWQLIKSGLVRGLSIGFRPTEDPEPIKGSFGVTYRAWEWLELSAVTIPANADASITQIKSADQAALRAAHGAHGAQKGSRAGTTGLPDASGFSQSRKGTPMYTLQELVEQLAQKTARQNELIELTKAENRELNADEGSELDALDAECTKLNNTIRIKRVEERQAASAIVVRGANLEEARASRGGISFVRKQDPDEAFKGQAHTRRLIAKAMSYIGMREGNFVTPGEYAEKRWGKTHPNFVAVMKAAVPGGGTGSGEWGAELVQSDTRYTGDFVDFLYNATVFDRLPLRSVPARVHIKGQDGAATGFWIPESKGIPVTRPDFSSVELTPMKVGAIAVCSKELVADSSPDAEMWIRDSLVQAISQRIDRTFLSADALSAGSSPAGILNGVSAISPTGTDAAAVIAGFQGLYAPFLAANNSSGLWHVMTPAMATALSLMQTSLGVDIYPGLSAEGGKFRGANVITGDNVPAGTWIVLKPSDIWKIGDTGVDVSMSDTATIEQDSAPQGATDTPVAASATLVSLWQEDSVGFKIVRRINYQKRRTSAVAVMTGAEFGGILS